MAEILTQEQIDKLIKDANENQMEFKAVKKDNIFICTNCKHIEVFFNTDDTPYIFMSKRKGKCRNGYGHAYVSWSELERLTSSR